jgi:hypothetical protein
MGSALRRLLRLDEAALAGSPEAEAELEQLIDEHEDALFALAEAETTTIAGATAALRGRLREWNQIGSTGSSRTMQGARRTGRISCTTILRKRSKT